MGQLSGHEAGAAYQRKAERHDKSGVDKAKQRRHGRRGQELRQRDPLQRATDLDRAIILHRRQVLRDDVRGGKNDEAKERKKEKNQWQIAPDREVQIDPRPFASQLMDDEDNEHESAAKQQRVDQPRVQPVEPIALIEPGIEHAETDTGVEYAGPIRALEEFAVYRLARHAEDNADKHQRTEQSRIPKYPVPRPMVVEPAFDRSGNIERQFQVQRIGRNTVDHQSRRQVLHDEADRERNKGA